MYNSVAVTSLYCKYNIPFGMWVLLSLNLRLLVPNSTANPFLVFFVTALSSPNPYVSILLLTVTYMCSLPSCVRPWRKGEKRIHRQAPSLFLPASGSLRRLFLQIFIVCYHCNLRDCSLGLFYSNSSWPPFLNCLGKEHATLRREEETLDLGEDVP